MKILIISLSNLGDALLTYPALQALWSAAPDAQFHVLASPRTRELFESDRRIHRVWLWEKKASPLAKLFVVLSLARVGFDRVVDFRNSLTPLFIPSRSRTPLFRKSPGRRHRAQAHLDLVRGLLGSHGDEGRTTASGSSLPFGPAEEAEVEKWLEPGKRPVVMVPGARSHLKRWPAERFGAVADRLVERHGAQVLLVGEESERPIARQVALSMRGEATDLTGRTTLRQLAALLARARLVVTNDSACLHAAEIMGIPVVAIFGPTDEKKYGPRDPRSVVVRRRLVCAPCERALCPYGHECMTGIETDEVYSVAAGILDSTSSSGNPVHPEPVEGRTVTASHP